MASPLGLVAGIAMARAENVPSGDEFRVAIFPYLYGLTPMSVVVTQVLARNLAAPPPVPVTQPPTPSPVGGGGSAPTPGGGP
jgi:hypothetical protein